MMGLDYHGEHVTISGLDQLQRVLHRLPDRMTDRVLTGAVRQGGKIIAEEAASRAPQLTGKLSENIVVKKRRGIRGRFARYSVGPSGAAFYGMILELGSRFIPARPWLGPAFDATKAQILAKISDVLGRNVEREAKKLAGPINKAGLRPRRRGRS